MLELAQGLSAGAMDALAGLEARTVAADGGRLKLEWGVLKARTSGDAEDLLWWDGDRLVGFVGIYAFGPPTVELAGMVDPGWRRRGVGTALLDAAQGLCRQRGYEEVLLVVPRTTTAGGLFALSRGATLAHSELALVLAGAPPAGPSDPELVLRTATAADADEVGDLLEAGFGARPTDVLHRLEDETQSTLLAERRGRAVATVRVFVDGDEGGVYSLAVDPACQGKGIGRDVLRRVCQRLRDQGASRVRLEVSIDNDHALGLYTSLGFTQIATEDYYALPPG